MISLELSTIQHKNAERAWLAENIESFLAQGGQVVEAPGFVTKPLPVISFVGTPEQVKERRVRSMKAQADALALAEQVRGMAATMTIREVGKALTITRDVLRNIAKRHGFSFQPGAADKRKAILQHHATPEEDARDAVRLRAHAEIGVSIYRAAKHTGIGHTRAKRLAKDFGIEFKKRGKA